MCLDKLDIEYSQPNDSEIRSRSLIPEFTSEDVYARIETAGFDAALDRYVRNRQERFKIVIRDDDYTAYVQLSGNVSSNHGLCLYRLDLNPSKFSNLREMWLLLEAINPFFRQDIFNDGVVRRIDYMLDYQIPFSVFRQGVFYDPVQNLYACANEDMSLREYHYDPVDFKSFRIGKNNKVFRFYDKGWKDHSDRGNPDAPIRPKARVELSLSGAAAVASFWGRGYRGRLAQLPDHLQDIIAGSRKPFSPVTLYKAEHKSSALKNYRYIDNQHNNFLRFKVQHGLLISLWRECRQRMINFWDHTRHGFALFRWKDPYQPTQAYASRLNTWCYMHRSYDPHGIVLPDHYAHAERVTEGNLSSNEVFIKPRHPSRPTQIVRNGPAALHQNPVVSEVSP